MMYYYFYSKVFTDNITYLDNETLDIFISIVLIVLLPIIIVNKRYKIKQINIETTYSIWAIIFLMFALLFAPIITDYNPNYQKDIRITRFLSPLSSVKVIHLRNSSFEKSEYINLKNSVVNYSVNENIIYADSIIILENDLIYFQNNIRKSINKNRLVSKNNVPFVSTKIFLFGTDELGRDLFSRIIYGARISMVIAFSTVAISLSIGLLFGFIAGYFGGIIDTILSRLTDMFLTIPTIFFVIMVLAFWGNSLFLVILVLAFSGWMGLFKIVKGEIISIKQKDYFIASQKLGLPFYKLFSKEIVPIIIVPIVVNVVFQFSNVILAESSLSYLGLGAGLNFPSWGNMVSSGQQYMSNGWWLILIPAIALTITLLSINSFGEELKKRINPNYRDDK